MKFVICMKSNIFSLGIKVTVNTIFSCISWRPHLKFEEFLMSFIQDKTVLIKSEFLKTCIQSPDHYF